MANDLYRHFDEQGELLYIGISLSAMARLGQHKRTSEWVDQISTMTIEKYNSREELKVAEKLAVAHEKPKYNIKLQAKERSNKKRTRRQDERFISSCIEEFGSEDMFRKSVSKVSKEYGLTGYSKENFKRIFLSGKIKATEFDLRCLRKALTNLQAAMDRE